MGYTSGDRVAWDHVYATDHAEGSVLHSEAVAAKAPDARFGTVVEPCPYNEAGTWYSVQVDGETDPRVLTADELVKVVDA